MSKYTVIFYGQENSLMDYYARQDAANRDNCICYVEHHFNSSPSEKTNYTLVVVASNASETSKKWGKFYASRISECFKTKTYGDSGIIVGGFGGRGNANLKKTKMPAILVEPLFASNIQGAGLIRSISGQQSLAACLVESIMIMFPEGGKVAFSVGHKYKKSHPKDRGAALNGGGMEADFAEKVLRRAEILLTSVE